MDQAQVSGSEDSRGTNRAISALADGIRHGRQPSLVTRRVPPVLTGAGHDARGGGIETNAERMALEELGLTAGQGYLFGRPDT